MKVYIAMFQHKSYIEKNPEISAKMLSINQIAGFSNQLFLQNKLIKRPQFLHVDTSAQKLKVDGKFLGMVKNVCGQFGLWTLKLTVSKE